MNILHLLSQNHLTGAEVYAVTLAHQQIEQQHQVYQLSNGFYFPSRAIKLKLEIETRSKITFIKNVLWLRNFIRKQNIHVVHTHSRASAKLAYWALLFSNTAQVSTVHGVQHSSFSKKLHNQYGEFIIAICENVKNHLVKDFSYSERRMKIIPNPLDATEFHYLQNNKPASGAKRIAIIGRTTGPKKQRTEQVLNELKSLPFDITLVGGALTDLDITPDLRSKIKEVHSVGLNSEFYSGFDLIVGSGRVCIEALMTGVPVIAFGEAKYIGLITENNFHAALKSNFGDIHPDSKEPRIDSEKFRTDVQSAAGNPEVLAKLAFNEFSLKKISQNILRIYESAYFLKNYSSWIPTLMYHKIPDAQIQSQHKIFVTKKMFEKHLQFFKKRGFQTLTFSELQKFRTGRKSFKEFPKKPLILTFDDGYRDNLENASPLLKKYGFRAQLFLLSDSDINKNAWDANASEPAHEIVSGAERLKWKDSAFEIGSHGFSHQKITEFDSQSALIELSESKKALEREFDRPVNVFAFTYGITAQDSAELAQTAGYDYAVNTDSGGLLMEEDPYSIYRVNIFPDENRLSLFKKTSKWYRKYYYFKRNK